MSRVLVLDGNQRSALAVTRALGRRRIPVTVADDRADTLAGASRYCRETFVYPSPSLEPDRFIARLRISCAQRGIEVLLPMTDVTTHLVLQHRKEFPDIRIPFPSLEAFEALTDKLKLVRLAHALGIPTPATYPLQGYDDVLDLPADLDFPIVLKPYRSRICRDGRWIPAAVQFVRSRDEMAAALHRYPDVRLHPVLAQELIRGHGQGVFALYNCGVPVAFFAHRRLREKPPSGGVSVFSESIALDERFRDMARRILDHVGWHGVAMVEFKVTRDGRPYLMEVNARFWGSLQLAIDAGVDFPYLLYRVAAGEDPERVHGYRVGTRSRWLLGDLDHLYLRFRDAPSPDPGGPSKWRSLLQFVTSFAAGTRYDVNRWDDWRPFLTELKQYRRAAG